MNRWQVKVTFCMNEIPAVEFVVDDFDSVLNVIRTVKFKNEVFRYEFWQNRELIQPDYGNQVPKQAYATGGAEYRKISK